MSTKKAEIEFARQALKEALERMKPELVAAGEAAHKLDELENDEAEDSGFARIVDQGHLVNLLAQLCGPRLRVLTDIAEELAGLDCQEKEEDQPATHQCH
jgi:hypothetical protein